MAGRVRQALAAVHREAMMSKGVHKVNVSFVVFGDRATAERYAAKIQGTIAQAQAKGHPVAAPIAYPAVPMERGEFISGAGESVFIQPPGAAGTKFDYEDGGDPMHIGDEKGRRLTSASTVS